jgi:hypothetical protein
MGIEPGLLKGITEGLRGLFFVLVDCFDSTPNSAPSTY